MPLVEALTGLLFGSLYAGAVWVIALALAIPYAAWVGLRKLARAIGGNGHGDASTGG